MKRVLTAVLLAPIFVYVVLWAPQLAFLAVLAAVAALCFHEYGAIAAGYGVERPGPIAYAAGLALLLAPADPGLLIVLLALAALGWTLRLDRLDKSLPSAAMLLLGLVYIFGVWRCAIPLRARSPYWLLFALALSWVGDMAAYYVGRKLGRHKLAPRVSPGKTWEGAAASLVGSALFGAVYLTRLLPAVPLWAAIGLAAAGNLAGQIGDLAESALKRGAGVKDSGSMLPGHGGWLDRVDSSLFALPVICWLVFQFSL
jgi:phosphatidate cytidylyltransferase